MKLLCTLMAAMMVMAVNSSANAQDSRKLKGFVVVPMAAANATGAVKFQFEKQDVFVQATPILTGADLQQATLQVDETLQGDVRKIDLDLNQDGAKKLSAWFNGATNKQVAAIVDGKVISVFTVSGPNSDGGLTITGNISRHDGHKFVKEINRHAPSSKKP